MIARGKVALRLRGWDASSLSQFMALGAVGTSFLGPKNVLRAVERNQCRSLPDGY